MKVLLLVLCCASFGFAPMARTRELPETDYGADIEFALEELGQQCGHFFELKGIDWKKVSKQFRQEVKSVKTDQEHLVLLVRLLARLKDGHAEVRPLPAGENVRWPEEPELTGPGMFWCRIGKKLFVKNAWNDALAGGVKPGMEILKVNGEKALDWVEARMEELADRQSFSTPHQAEFFTLHWGLADEIGTRMKLEVKVEGRKKKRTVTYGKANPTPWGPAFIPPNCESTQDLNFGKTTNGWGYVHVRRCKGDLPRQMEEALTKLADLPGLILDFRGNSGGGFDHDEFLGQFIPSGKSIAFEKRYSSAGSHSYGGPIVVIVDATVRSAGETGSGIFKEDGRAYMIGESPTAGMSASKNSLNLPSGLFSLYFAVASNKGRFNDGRGIEGIGVIPHELVSYRPEDLLAETDTLIRHAEQLLEEFPQEDVPYDPADFGWKR